MAEWQEFSFEPRGSDGQSHHVYSREEAESLIADGVIQPSTSITLFLDGGRRKVTTADALGLSFPGQVAVPPPVEAKPKAVVVKAKRPSPPAQDAEARVVLPAVVPAPPTRQNPWEAAARAPAPPPAPTERLTRVEAPAPMPQPAPRPGPTPPPFTPTQAGLIGVALLLLLVIGYVWTRPEQRWTVVDSDVHVLADVESAIITTLPPGTMVKVEEMDDPTWVRIAEGEYQGNFLIQSSLTDTEPVAEAALAEAAPAAVAEPAVAPEPVVAAAPAPSPTEEAEAAARREREAERRAIPPACREWTARAKIDLCIAVQGRFAELRSAYAGSAIGGEQPEQTLRSAITGCSSRRCVEQRMTARIGELSRVVAPAATLSPSVVDRSRPPTLRGDPSNWISQDDYPSAAIRREAEGTTGVTLLINANGRVANCAVDQSSGHADLDAAACRAMTRRARYEPALDSNGNPTTATVTKRIRWQLPDR